MADQIQTEMIQTLLLLALSLCFNPGEEYLTEEQILNRGFSPTSDYGRTCLQSLIDSGVVKYKCINSATPLTVETQLRYFQNPAAEWQDHRLFISEHSLKLLDLLKKKSGNELYFLSLQVNIKAQECVEYADFYANKSRICITNKGTSSPKLILMLMELKLENVFALIWRSIKLISRESDSNIQYVHFSELINLAFEKYTDEKKSPNRIDAYKRPSQIKLSKISWVAENYCPRSKKSELNN